MAYAVAKAEAAPLLFVDGDFAKTDVAAAGSGGLITHPTLAGGIGPTEVRSVSAVAYYTTVGERHAPGPLRAGSSLRAHADVSATRILSGRLGRFL